MSENEKRLRQYLEMFTSESAEQSLDDVDALLAEHRAEVERLTAERDEWETNARTERAHRERQVAELSAKVSTARDAALEEAAAAIDGGQVTGSLVLGGWYRRYADRIRAMKSCPDDRYLRESEVRRAIKEARHASGDMTASDERNVLRRLGVALDADGETTQAPCHGYECDIVPGDPCAKCGRPFTEHSP